VGRWLTVEGTTNPPSDVLARTPVLFENSKTGLPLLLLRLAATVWPLPISVFRLDSMSIYKAQDMRLAYKEFCKHGQDMRK